MADDPDDWETLADSGELDKRLADIQPPSQPHVNQGTPVQSIPVLREDTVKTTFKPQVKILKRNPDKEEGSGRGSSKDNGKHKSHRTLEEREAAYALARQRIFGTEKSSEDGQTDNTEQTNNSNSNYTGPSLGQQFDNMRLARAPQVLRQPKGPDGTSGFQTDSRNHVR